MACNSLNVTRLSPLYIAQNVNETPVQIQICKDQKTHLQKYN